MYMNFIDGMARTSREKKEEKAELAKPAAKHLMISKAIFPSISSMTTCSQPCATKTSTSSLFEIPKGVPTSWLL